jgi:tRNA-Thr(GGU) m(6)t(6)A37 methyltransferase TsaA
MAGAGSESLAFGVKPIGAVRSPLADRSQAPKQGDEGAPEATLEIEPQFLPALDGTVPGDEVLLLTWFHLADRTTQRVHPRGDTEREPTGVFATRSPDRPNPIGLHRVTVLAIDGPEVRVSGLEAVDGTPLLDIKPVLSADAGDR